MSRRLLILLVFLVGQAVPAFGANRDTELDRWVERELVPFVREQLVEHPRFKGETVMFVVLEDNSPASVTNALALSLRDRLLAAAVDTHGVSIGWQQGRGTAKSATQAIDCTRDDVHYYIGVELRQRLDSDYAVNVRALDIEDRSLVTGFGRSWQGRLSTVERRALRQPRVDETFLGGRDVPFSTAQSDLLAAHLAHDLSCSLLRAVDDDYVVAAATGEPTEDVLDGTLALAGNHLANHSAIEVSGDETRINAVLSGKAHLIDGPLYQYWLTITPVAGADAISALSSSAYVLLPGHALAGGQPEPVRPPAGAIEVEPPRVAEAAVAVPNWHGSPALGPLRVMTSPRTADCARGASMTRHADYRSVQSRCSLLAATADADAIVFFLNHQVNHGLVRLGGPQCRERTAATVMRSRELMRFPMPQAIARPHVQTTNEWLLAPRQDTYYAVAVTDARAARSLANHIDKLPLRCAEAMRKGLSDTALRRWLDEFAVLARRSSGHFGWRAITVSDVL